MYSYGGFSSAAGGKRGHGGGNYRPPPPRRDPNSTPPPLKECGCLFELNIAEYEKVATATDTATATVTTTSTAHEQEILPRQHAIFGGRKKMQNCEKLIRKMFHVHLIIPGKKQKGPVGIVGKSIYEVVPATAWLLQQFVKATPVPANTDADARAEGGMTSSEFIELYGRVFLDVKDVNGGIVGRFQSTNTTSAATTNDINNKNNANDNIFMQPYLLFQSEKWCVLACTIDETDNSDADDNNSTEKMVLLQTCLDNVQFGLGNNAVNELEIFLDVQQQDKRPKQQQNNKNKSKASTTTITSAFAAGNPQQVNLLFQEISKAAGALQKQHQKPKINTE